MIMCVLLCYPVSIHMSQLLSTGRPISSSTFCFLDIQFHELLSTLPHLYFLVLTPKHVQVKVSTVSIIVCYYFVGKELPPHHLPVWPSQSKFLFHYLGQGGMVFITVHLSFYCATIAYHVGLNAILGGRRTPANDQEKWTFGFGRVHSLVCTIAVSFGNSSFFSRWPPYWKDV